METLTPTSENPEIQRLHEAHEQAVPWKRWGPYLSERQWGTVREDYSESGDAWNYFSHDQARSRAYRWGEDGIAGISDDRQHLCFALALWNEQDPILKERMFGLTNGEGNHGEDVKEYYFYLDNTPTHSYMKYLYKYPQAAFPYTDLVNTNRARSRYEFEYELLDTGIFRENRYFDVFVEYAKNSPDDILIRITAYNRGPEPKPLRILPTLWFRNTWQWVAGVEKPSLNQGSSADGVSLIEATHPELGRRYLYCEGNIPLFFTENENNNRRLFGGENLSPYVKDGINDTVVNGATNAVNPEHKGTKSAAHYAVEIGAGSEAVIRLRLCDNADIAPFADFDQIMDKRRGEADEFYRSITPPMVTEDAAQVMRQALSGMLWTKQYYDFNVDQWLYEHGADQEGSHWSRNREWFHMLNSDIISMPDKWEYPWYAAWDLAFHTIALSSVDVDFAQRQLDLMLRELYLHPNGQLPAYEWNFSDVNPPVHAWASLFVYQTQKSLRGEGDVEFLKHAFSKLMLNFTWWVNRKDRFGKNVFEGGFLGLDNIGVFDRSAPLPTGGYLEQADGTAWMAMFCQNMLEIANELAAYDPVYDDLSPKFADHFLLIASAMNRMGRSETGLWDEEDGFYYDVLRLPDGSSVPLKVRSMVGLLPLCATTVVEKYQRERVPRLLSHIQRRRGQVRNLQSLHPTGPGHFGVAERGIFALVNPDRLRRILTRMLDENEFLSPHGIRSLSRYHAEHPYSFYVDGQEYRVDYLPAESDSGMFGGNSNWRGPIWFPVNGLIIRALLQFYLYYGENFKVECPTGSGQMMNLFEVAREITNRL
ncbi:MGH1-like glycoside hydrolase domain-containing protein, partial [Petrachloros mirabilis]